MFYTHCWHYVILMSQISVSCKPVLRKWRIKSWSYEFRTTSLITEIEKKEPHFVGKPTEWQVNVISVAQVSISEPFEWCAKCKCTYILDTSNIDIWMNKLEPVCNQLPICWKVWSMDISLKRLSSKINTILHRW